MSRDYDDDFDDRAEAEEGTDMDPEKWLMRMEQEQEEESGTPEGEVFQAIREVLSEYPENEIRMFLTVFLEGTSVAEAARMWGVKGSPTTKFNRMLELVRSELGNDS